jgi:probable aminopeptidase NPEPL1
MEFMVKQNDIYDLSETIIGISPASWLKSGWLEAIEFPQSQIFGHKIEQMKSPLNATSTFQSLTGQKIPAKLCVVGLMDQPSRYNSRMRKDAMIASLSEQSAGEKSIGVIVGVESSDDVDAVVGALSRVFGRIDFKKDSKPAQVRICLADKNGKTYQLDQSTEALAHSVKFAMELVDTPPSELSPSPYCERVKECFASQEDVEISEIAGAQLIKEGMCGLHAVGRAAEDDPRLLVLEYAPKSSQTTIVLIGKGLTYDTGGLSLKISGSMAGMKSDMAGSAAVIGAFRHLVETKPNARIIVGLGIVENAIGPKSYKLDDVLQMHSGKTVEVNNTDAEGRIVLADANSYLVRRYKPDFVIEAATLTGAQMIATGKLHAAVFSNDQELENHAVAAGKDSGDLVAPLPFVPEVYQELFKSKIADMKNSVSDRFNAQSGCAAQFVYSHIDDCETKWLHIDLAGPSFVGERATGYGVLLISELVSRLLR